MNSPLHLHQLTQLFILITAFLSAITIHEFSHAWVAYLLGDDTAKRFGRLTLNPLAHIDPFGFLFLLFFRIGWAKPVPMDARNFYYPRFFAILAGLAGPFSNFVFALAMLYLAHYFPIAYIPANITLALFAFLRIAIWINVMLGVFNLLPLPPLDGSHILYALIPERWHHLYFAIARFSIFILLFLFLFPETARAFLQATQAMQTFLERLVI